MLAQLPSLFAPALSWLSGFTAHAPLALVGALLVSLPILIHLLNKRKFRTVDWAAMDFLLEADKKNRRRIRLENLLLLLLRCLAVLLIGLLAARPFLPSEWTRRLLDAPQYERLVVLDDSLSMQARSGNRSSFEEAKRAVIDFVRSLAGDGNENSLTLLLTSRVEKPLYRAQRITGGELDELVATIDALEPTESASRLDEALRSVERDLEGQPRTVNRIVYVVTDFRRPDWQPSAAASETDALPAILRRVQKLAAHCLLVDVGQPDLPNLSLTELKPREPGLIAGVAGQEFEATVLNQGESEVQDLSVKLTITPQQGTAREFVSRIDSLPPGEAKTTSFSVSFPPRAVEGRDAGKAAAPVRIEARLENVPSEADRLDADNARSYAGRLSAGTPVLLVDGDPSAARGRAETYFLKRALAPPGAQQFGIAPEVVTETEFEARLLNEYRVVYLCNISRLSKGRKQELEGWVRRGGSLVWMLGDQVDEDLYNREFSGQQGLLPVKLLGIRGDESREKFVRLTLAAPDYPPLRALAGAGNPFLDEAKFFRWWSVAAIQDSASQGKPSPPATEVAPDKIATAARDAAGKTLLAATLSDEAQSPVVIERRLGEGKLVVFAIPADSDWHDWPDYVSYILMQQDLVHYLSRHQDQEGQFAVGQPLAQAIDVAQYAAEAELSDPRGKTSPLQASPAGGEPTSATQWQFRSPRLSRQGFYELQLERKDGSKEPVLFAAAPAASEGDLHRLSESEIRRQLGDSGVGLVRGEAWASAEQTGARRELWKYLVLGLIAVLFAELSLAWLFGTRR